MKDLHSLMDTDGKGMDKSVAEKAFSEMDSDHDGVDNNCDNCTFWLAFAPLRLRDVPSFETQL